jgi:hypothetical protein
MTSQQQIGATAFECSYQFISGMEHDNIEFVIQEIL